MRLLSLVMPVIVALLLLVAEVQLACRNGTANTPKRATAEWNGKTITWVWETSRGSWEPTKWVWETTTVVTTNTTQTTRTTTNATEKATTSQRRSAILCYFANKCSHPHPCTREEFAANNGCPTTTPRTEEKS